MLCNKTIRISSETHQRLTNIAFKGETYDDIINRVLNHYDPDDYLTPEQEERYSRILKEIDEGTYTDGFYFTKEELKKRN